MSDVVWIAVVNGTVTIIGLMITTLLSRLAHQATKNEISAVHTAVNSTASRLAKEAEDMQKEILRLTKENITLHGNARAIAEASAVKEATHTPAK